MKQLRMILFLSLILFLLTAASVSAQFNNTIDPILLNEPNDQIYNCKNDIFIEVIGQPSIDTVAARHYAQDYFLAVTVKVLYLAEVPMQGLDKASFTARHKESGFPLDFPLNYVLTMASNRISNTSTLSQTLRLPRLRTYQLVFDITTRDKENWVLLFTPTERGGSEAYCEIEVPLKIK